jgi:hypothetical protein
MRELVRALLTFDLLVVLVLAIGVGDVACGDNTQPHVVILSDDAEPDAGVDGRPADACVAPAQTDCCVHISEGADAVRACIVTSTHGGAEAFCGDAYCELPDCELVEVPYCVPAAADAGVDALPESAVLERGAGAGDVAPHAVVAGERPLAVVGRARARNDEAVRRRDSFDDRAHRYAVFVAPGEVEILEPGLGVLGDAGALGDGGLDAGDARHLRRGTFAVAPVRGRLAVVGRRPARVRARAVIGVSAVEQLLRNDPRDDRQRDDDDRGAAAAALLFPHARTVAESEARLS